MLNWLKFSTRRRPLSRSPRQCRLPLRVEALEARLTPAGSTFNIASVSPNNGPVTGGGPSITITTDPSSTSFSGSGNQLVTFTDGSHPTQQQATYVDGHHIMVTTPVALPQFTPGNPINLSITDTMDPGPQTTTGGTGAFTYNNIVISSISPTSGYTTGGYPITINATDDAHGFGQQSTFQQLSVGFTMGLNTTFAGAVQWVSPTKIVVAAPSPQNLTTGTYTVSVYLNGKAVSTGANQFQYTPPPVFTSANILIANNAGSQLPSSNVYLLLEGNGSYYTVAPTGSANPGTLMPITSTLTSLGNVPKDQTGMYYQVTIPQPFTSARLYVTTDPNMTTQPKAGTTGSAYYDYVEPNLASDGLNVDTTQVDQFGMPITIQVVPNDPAHTSGSGVNNGVTRDQIIQQYQNQMSTVQNGLFQPYLDSISTTNPTYQILAPQYVINDQFTAQQQTSTQTATITPSGGSSGHWTATLGGLTPPTNAFVSGPYIPAGTMINNGVLVNTSTSATNPFTSVTITPAANGEGLNFIPLPAGGFTDLASWFGPTWGSTTNLNSGNAIDALFTYYKTNSFYQEDNGNGVQLYTGQLKQITAANITGGTSTYAVLQFTNGTNETYNIFYPYFTTNSPVGKTDPFGNQVPPPPQYFQLGNSQQNITNYLSPSQMVFGASGVFADQLAQTAQFSVSSTTVLADLERDVAAALIRGYGTTLISTANPLSAPDLPYFTVNPSDNTKGTWTLTSPQDLALAPSLKKGMYLDSFKSSKLPMQITDISIGTTSATISVSSVNGPITTPLPPDNLQFFYLYQSGSTYDAYSAFFQNRGDFTGGTQINIEGRAYGDPYSDYMDFSSDINSTPDPLGAAQQTGTLYVTLQPWGAQQVPAAPTQVVAQAGDAQVALSWQASTGAASYNVYRSLTSHGTSTKIASGVTSTGYTDTGLTNGTTYFYYVTAVNTAGESTGSNEASATPMATLPPLPPTNVQATAGNTQVGLTWTVSAGATGYNIYRGLTSRGESTTPINASPVTTTSYNDTTVTNGTTYFYYVKAVSGAGQSHRSNEVSATPAAPAPPAPTNLTATPSTGQVQLNWTASAGAATYNIYRGTTSGGESTTPLAAGVTGTTYTDNAVTGGTTYYYYVRAVNGQGTQSTPSTEVSATPPAATPPPVPTSLAAQGNDGSVSLTWNPSTGATSYNLYRGTTAGGEGSTPINATPITGTTYNDTAVTNGTTYFYVVRAVNNAGSSGDSNEASATPAAAQPPPAPTQLAAAPGDAQVTLTWNASPGALGYNVYRGLTSGGESSTPIISGWKATTYIDSTVSNGVTYFYVVTAVDGGQESADSNEASATPVVPGSPATPTNLSAQPLDSAAILTWNPSPGAVSYNLYRGTTSGGETNPPINSSPITTTSYTDTGLTNGTTYYYIAESVNAVGASGDSNEASATPSNTMPPPAPTGLAATGGLSQIALRWNSAPSAVTYNVYRGTSSGGEQAPAIATGLTGTTYTDTTVTNGKTYFYVVTAVNAASTESDDSNEASATPQKQTLGIAIQPFASPISFGTLPQSYTVILSVIATDPAPTGATNLTLDGNTVGTTSTYTSLGGGQYSAAFSYNGAALTAGQHILRASFAGDSDYNSVTSTPKVQVVDPAQVSVTFPASAVTPNPSKDGQGVTYTVNLTTSVASGVANATGSVSFTAKNVSTGATTNLGSAPLSGSGNSYSATLTTPPTLGPGTYDITASYSGDANYAAGTTATPASQTVQPAPIMKIGYSNPPQTLIAGTKTVLSIDVSNVGSADDTTVFITASLPANTSFVPELSTPGWTAAAPGAYRLPIGDVAVGQQVGVRFAVATAQNAPFGQVVTTTASVYDASSVSALATAQQNLTIRAAGSIRWPKY